MQVLCMVREVRKYKQRFNTGVSLEILLLLILTAKQDGRKWKVPRVIVITHHAGDLLPCRL